MRSIGVQTATCDQCKTRVIVERGGDAGAPMDWLFVSTERRRVNGQDWLDFCSQMCASVYLENNDL